MLTYESKDSASYFPVKVIGAKAQERLPSYREPAGPKPVWPYTRELFIECAYSRTVSPSLHSCPASGGASSFLLASAPIFNRPCDLPKTDTRDAYDRLLPPERFTCTRTSCVPGSLRDFRRVDTPRSLGLHAVYRGTECFTTLVNASADRHWTRAAILPLCLPYRFRCVSSERGRFLPTAPANRSSL
jgi:hypothetical protein